jgi:predicted ATP pyrophosphatase (TIGR00289 family)
MRLAALVSGGKDSLYAVYLAGKEHEIKYIVSIISENPESYMFHFPNARLVEKQAELMQIPLIQKITKGEKEKELEDLKDALKEISNEIDGVVTGATASHYQKERIDKICEELNLKSVAPLWHRDPEKLLREMIASKFDIIITAVAAPPLDEKWLGREINESCVEELIELNEKYSIHAAGEGGEYESFVCDCPLFKKKIEILESEKIWDKKTKSGVLNIKKIKLVNKN